MNTYKPHWNSRTYSQEEFITAWTSSRSIAQCARKLNLTIYGATYTTLRKTAESLQLSSDHMKGRGWNTPDQPDHFLPKNTTRRNITDDELFRVDSPHSQITIKKRIIKNNLIPLKCSAPFCPNPDTTINGLTGETVSTPLTLDHINGVNDDNRLENLRFICPNCDRFTDTFCRGGGPKKKSQTMGSKSTSLICPECLGPKSKKAKNCKECVVKKNLQGGFIKYGKRQPIKDLCSCGNSKLVSSKSCKPCHISSLKQKALSQPTKINWPDDATLLSMLHNSNYSELGKRLGVSDNAVRKRVGRIKDRSEINPTERTHDV